MPDTSIEDNWANHFIEVPRCISPDGWHPAHNSDSDDEGGQILAVLDDFDVDVAQVESEGSPVDVTVMIEAAHMMTMESNLDLAGTTTNGGATTDDIDTHSTSNNSK